MTERLRHTRQFHRLQRPWRICCPPGPDQIAIKGILRPIGWRSWAGLRNVCACAGPLAIVLFSLFFGLGLLLRHRKQIHQIDGPCYVGCDHVGICLAAHTAKHDRVGHACGLFSLAWRTTRYVTNLTGVLLINMSSRLRFMIADTQARQKLAAWARRIIPRPFIQMHSIRGPLKVGKRKYRAVVFVASATLTFQRREFG